MLFISQHIVLGAKVMADQKRKIEMIRSIENLQLPPHLISALDDRLQAEAVLEAISSLQVLNQQWN